MSTREKKVAQVKKARSSNLLSNRRLRWESSRLRLPARREIQLGKEGEEETLQKGPRVLVGIAGG
jgi:hypothetical protein